MLAYSAISHMGFMLLGMVTGVVGGDARFALNAYSSSMFYVITYVLTSAGTFGMILLLARAGLESDELDDFKGLNKRSPWFAGMMMMMMFSMAGIPFFVGFFCQVLGIAGGGRRGLSVARHRCHSLLADRLFLLSARGQAHVLRSTDEHLSDTGTAGRQDSDVGQRSGGCLARYLSASLDVALRFHASAVALTTQAI
jgi:NADH:ubiquinone oxidoreductase subunit 4 (subunit M)